ncbi:MAG: autoinducer binding domain-containing protein [Rhodobacteraceae bacterium]|nr:autoinducer binding domain-containing protein [Paracoccaceae bacterium]
MPVFGNHFDQTSKHTLHGLVQTNMPAPDRLQTFLADLSAAENKGDVWSLLVELSTDLGQRYVSYAFTKVTNYSTLEFNFRSNAPDEWKTWLASKFGGDEREIPYKNRLGLTAVGIEFLDDYARAGNLSPEFKEFLDRSAAIGWKSGLLIPLRTVRRAEYGGMTIAGGMNKQDFFDFVKEHGWTLSVASLQAHLVYKEFMFREEAESYDLSERHLDFLRQSARGHEIKAIAHNWQRSQQYVTRIRREVCERLGVASKMAVMAKAARLDILIEQDFQDLESVKSTWD